MTNTYEASDDIEYQKKEELRCIRCVLERLLRAKYPQEFVDYQDEKFDILGKMAKLHETKKDN